MNSNYPNDYPANDPQHHLAKIQLKLWELLTHHHEDALAREIREPKFQPRWLDCLKTTWEQDGLGDALTLTA